MAEANTTSFCANEQHHYAAGLEGGNSRILLPLSQHARNTLLSLARLHPQSSLRISPFCHEHPEGAHEVRGWCLDTPGSAPASCLPINCSMFDGVSVVRCDCSEAEILELLSNADDTRRRLGQAIDSIMTKAGEQEDLRASWRRCRPTLNGTSPSLCSASIVTAQGANNTNRKAAVNFFNTQECVPIIDSEHWLPELSPEGFIGLYHHWNHHHCETNGQRTGLSLYVVCQSYLPKACLEFADMVRDIGDACTASEVYHSEEAYWLRQACARNRCRMIASVCQSMKIRFPAMLDYNACRKGASGKTLVALSCVETLHHDIQGIVIKEIGHQSKERELVRILNFCTAPHYHTWSQFTNHNSATSTTFSRSDSTAGGSHSICVMAPWEGVWIFHANQLPRCSARDQTLFFPSITPKITEQDHLTLKQKNRAGAITTTMKEHATNQHHHNNFFSFTCDIPEVCETLNIYQHFFEKNSAFPKKRKSKKNKPSSVTQASALRQMLAMQELHDIATASMLTLPSMGMDNQALDTMKQVMAMKNEERQEDTVIRENDNDDDDVMKAYKSSITKLTSLVMNHFTASTDTSVTGADHAVSFLPHESALLTSKKRPRKHTFLTFDESVLQAMEAQGWKRGGGYTVLIPLACGLCEHWKRLVEESQPVI